MKASLEMLNHGASIIPMLLLQWATPSNGHYGFPFVEVDGVMSERWEYVRPSGSFAPNWDYSGISAMCGENATKPLFPIKTLKVEAGKTVTFGASGQKAVPESDSRVPFDPTFGIYHEGPATAYLSKAPGELADYEGDGDWFKIAAVGASDGMNWDVRQTANINKLHFIIPKTTPPGKYLMRAEHLNISPFYKGTQMYQNCAHLEITGSGGGKPSPTTKFPGAFSAMDPGIWLPNALERPYEPLDQLKNWQGAGPKVWQG
ncbi:glycosyl hydrolase family 61-domain-containing protein [Clohesyomyces aquaticus]|uniref:lytic cellulose monooxygenase (C4-dehydrogenating) n=1 Tax=Clohesyomyces aquaticus TaxID=1231657 RepID=A0A1Y1Z372_9PLEO|nr:glycosyl hydrolase family 61-domain-containing protein [Clohesyomyces aquaticus]